MAPTITKAPANTAAATTLENIPIGNLVESPTNPRRHVDDDRFRELVESIKAKGVKVPIKVRPIAGGKFEIVYGARRVRAAKIVRLEQIPATVEAMTDDDVIETQIVENLHREDVHPLDEATGYQALVARGYEVPAIAAKVGKSPSYVHQRLKLADLTPAARKAFTQDTIALGHALLIARLQPADQDRASQEVTHYSPGQKRPAAVSVRELARWIDETIHLDLHGAAWKKDDADLIPEAGPCTTCPKRTGSNPGLFPDVKKGDTCTDPACFQAKARAFTARQVGKLEAEGKRVVQITTREHLYGRDLDQVKKAGVLRPYDRYGGSAEGTWRPAGKQVCDFAAVGLVIDGPRKAIGSTSGVCTAPTKCPVHADREERRERADTSRSDATARARERKRKAEIETRRAIVMALAEKLDGKTAGTLAPPDLVLVARAVADQVHYDDEKALLPILGLERPKAGTFSGATGAAIRKHVAGAKGPALVKFLLVASVARLIDAQYFSHRNVTLQDLDKTAARHGVNIRGIKAAQAKKAREAAARAKAREGAKRKKAAKAVAAARSTGRRGATTKPTTPAKETAA